MTREFAFVEATTTADWNSWEGSNFEVSDGTVHLEKETTPVLVSPELILDKIRPGVGVTDIDVDRCGIGYLLGTDGNVYRLDPTWGDPQSLPCIWRSDERIGAPEALCVSDETIYVTFSATESDHSENESPQSGVYFLSKHRRPTHETVDNQPDISFKTPTRIVAGSGEYDAFILDKGEGNITGLLGDGMKRPVVNGLQSPEDITIDEQGCLYVLDARDARESKDEEQTTTPVEDQTGVVLERYDPPEDTGSSGIEWPKTVLTADLPLEGSACIEVVDADTVFVGVHPDAAVSGEEVLFRYQVGDDTPEPIYSFKQSCTRLQRGRSMSPSALRGLYAITRDERAVYFLNISYNNKPNKRSESGGTESYRAHLQHQFDSGIHGMEWHRLQFDLDTSIPGTQVRVKYAATNEVTRRRTDWTEAKRLNPQDVLLDRATGRYLLLRIELTGSEYTSPYVKSVRAYFPQRSYLQHLPAVYAADSNAGDFLHRFLTIFESTFAEFDDELAGFTQYLDPYAVPEDSLAWLESWLAITAEQSWSIDARRTLLERAPTLFKKRGTKAGLRELLEIYLQQHDSSKQKPERDHFFSIIEYADLYCPPSRAYDREASNAFTAFFSSPQEFLVLLGPTVDEAMRRSIEQIVDSEKPAHTAAKTVALQPRMRLGDHVYLGVNTRLPTRDLVVGESTLGETSILGG